MGPRAHGQCTNCRNVPRTDNRTTGKPEDQTLDWWAAARTDNQSNKLSNIYIYTRIFARATRALDSLITIHPVPNPCFYYNSTAALCGMASADHTPLARDMFGSQKIITSRERHMFWRLARPSGYVASVQMWCLRRSTTEEKERSHSL